MKKEKKDKKGFFKEFKEFIARGNVFDLAVGVIIGGAFTAIVNALCNNILKPIINWILALIVGEKGLDGVYTYLKKVTDPVTGGVDLVNSIYIDWGAFINAVINFLLIALVLFLIIKAMMAIKRASEATKEKLEEKAAERAAKEAEEAAKKEAELNATVPVEYAPKTEAGDESPAEEAEKKEE